MATDTKIIGISLVRNEDLFLDRAIANAVDFCDHLYVAEHRSRDRTADIAQAWAKRDSRVSYHAISHPRESHDLIAPYASTPTWIFAVDGDELYDPTGLKEFRQQILSGRYDEYWRIIGNVLNCTQLDREAGRAQGYFAPPSRSIVKLYNFGAIVRWDEVPEERLHEGRLVFKPGFDEKRQLPLHEQVPWDASIFRCLHVCFLPRSSTDKTDASRPKTRWNLADQYSRGPLVRALSKACNTFGIALPSGWKQERYCRGELVTCDVKNFFLSGTR